MIEVVKAEAKPVILKSNSVESLKNTLIDELEDLNLIEDHHKIKKQTQMKDP